MKTCENSQQTFLNETEFPLMSLPAGSHAKTLALQEKQAGISDETRSGLWSEIVRLIGELSPRYVIVENVANLLSGPSEKRGGWFGRILGDLAERRYDAEWRNVPAWLVGRPHKRERAWLVAYPQQERRSGILPYFPSKCAAEVYGGNQATIALGASRDLDARSRGQMDGEPPLFHGTDGLSHLVDELGAAGNSVPPAIPELFGHAILEAEASL